MPNQKQETENFPGGKSPLQTPAKGFAAEGSHGPKSVNSSQSSGDCPATEKPENNIVHDAPAPAYQAYAPLPYPEDKETGEMTRTRTGNGAAATHDGKPQLPSGDRTEAGARAAVVVIDGECRETLIVAHFLSVICKEARVVICGTEETGAMDRCVMVSDNVKDMYYSNGMEATIKHRIPSIAGLLFPGRDPIGLWESLTEGIETSGGIFRPDMEVTRIKTIEGNRITSVAVSDSNGGEHTLECDFLITPRRISGLRSDVNLPRHITNLFCLNHDAQQWHESQREHALLSAIQAAKRINVLVKKY